MPKKIGDIVLYSIDDLHEHLGISKLTLRAYLREGKIKGRKLGVGWYVTEDALRNYFNGGDEGDPQEAKAAAPAGTKRSGKPKAKTSYKYVIQGLNDLVSETEECFTVHDAVECIKAQAIISLFQVAVIDRESGQVETLMSAREFLARHDKG